MQYHNNFMKQSYQIIYNINSQLNIVIFRTFIMSVFLILYIITKFYNNLILIYYYIFLILLLVYLQSKNFVILIFYQFPINTFIDWFFMNVSDLDLVYIIFYFKKHQIFLIKYYNINMKIIYFSISIFYLLLSNLHIIKIIFGTCLCVWLFYKISKNLNKKLLENWFFPSNHKKDPLEF